MQSDKLAVRRRRCLFRAQHRGTKEMDWLLGRYAQTQLASADAAEVTLWERLVQVPDPQLYDWIVNGTAVQDVDFASTIIDIRAVHGLSATIC